MPFCVYQRALYASIAYAIIISSISPVTESQHKGSNTTSVNSLVVDEARPLVGVSALSFLQYFVTVGWVTGRTSGL